MLAPDEGAASCSLWFIATPPEGPALARKATLPADQLSATDDPFALRIGDAELTDRGMRGGFEDVAWDLNWEPGRGYEHVSSLLRRAKVAKTVLVLPHGDVAVSGTVRIGDRELSLTGVHGGQAHLWGSKHATRWAWAHCGDFVDADGAPRPGSFVDGVSVIVPRLGREVGPSTPVVGRFLDDDFAATSPLAVLRAPSRFGLTSWSFEATDGKRRMVRRGRRAARIARRRHLHRPRRRARLLLQQRGGLDARSRCSTGPAAAPGWLLRETLVSHGRAHFEYAQREPVPDLELHLT